MNHNSLYRPASQLSQCCIHCGKGYKIRSKLEKHIVLCELIYNSKKIKNIEDDEDFVIPSQKKMFLMLLELGEKYNKLEADMNEINKWVIKKKKKINVLEWLNTNVTPTLVFEQLTDQIIINDTDVEFLLENSFLDTLNMICSKNVYNVVSEMENPPIFAFVQKSNIFYVFDRQDTSKVTDVVDAGVWMEMPKDKLVRFFMKIQMKIYKAFFEWKKKKNDKRDDKFDTLCDKTTVKVMGTDFKQDVTFGKMKTIMYTKMKTDMKSMVEYEFEF